MLIQWLRGNRLGSWTFGKARAPAGDVVGHAELQVGLAEGSHDAVSSGRNEKVRWAIISKTSGTDAVCAKKNNTPNEISSGFNVVDMFSMNV